jgi:hypothetical protein
LAQKGAINYGSEFVGSGREFILMSRQETWFGITRAPGGGNTLLVSEEAAKEI